MFKLENGVVHLKSFQRTVDMWKTFFIVFKLLEYIIEKYNIVLIANLHFKSNFI